jgi:ABC-type Fe3+ transport system permease subunit
VTTTVVQPTSTASADRPARAVWAIGLIALIAGIMMIVAGGAVWGMVSGQLADENITVSEDASMMAGSSVTGPISAFAQADVIAHHALEASDGKTYAELDQDDPVRATVMNASFLRASLFTSVVSFGVAAFAIGVGLLLALMGWALTALSSPSRRRNVATATA